MAALEASGQSVNPADASSIKVFGTEFFTDAYQLLAEILGQAANLTADSPAAVLASRGQWSMAWSSCQSPGQPS